MTGPVDNRTPNYSLPLPDLANFQDDDLQRVILALTVLDTALKAIADTAAAKAPLSHAHEMAQITGLGDALAAKMAATWRPALADLTGVDVGSAANGMVLKRVGAAWIAANVQLGDVPGWQDTVTALIASAIADRVGGAPAALDAFNELAAAIANDPNFATTMATALGNRVRVDAAQALTALQKAQALGNLGVSPLIQLLLDDTTETQALTTIGIGAGLRALRMYATAAEIWGALKVGATTADAGVVRKATSAELTAGTAERYPDAALLAPALLAARPAAMVNFDGTTSPVTIRAQRNVASVGRNSTGSFTINFSTPLGSADYISAISIIDPGGLQVGAAMISAQTAAALTIRCTSVNSNANTYFNPGTVSLIIYEP